LSSGTEGQKHLGQKKVGWVWSSVFFPQFFCRKNVACEVVAWLASGTEGQKHLGQKKLGWVWSSDFFALNFFAARMLLAKVRVVVLGNRGAKRSRAKKVGWVGASDFFALNFFAARMLLAKWYRGCPREQRGKNIWGKKRWEGLGLLGHVVPMISTLAVGAWSPLAQKYG
jgi:hypothetical protein